MGEQDLYKDLSKVGLCTENEYRYVGELIESYSPGNILIFGLGKDSNVWNNLNKNGYTAFLEDNFIYLKRNKHLNTFPISYTTQRFRWKELLQDTNKLYLPLGEEIESKHWDVIFIDGPKGFHKYTPGRMQSIFNASNLSYSNILVHDCDREVEKIYFETFIGKPTYTKERIFHFSKDE